MARPIRSAARSHGSARLVGALTIAFLVAACGASGGSGPTSPIEGQGASAGSSADTSTAVPASAAASVGASPGSPAPSEDVASPEPTAGSVDVDLATLLPTEIAGKTLSIEVGTNPASFLNLWKDPADAESFLAELGKTTSDVSIVYGSNSEDFPNLIYLTGYRVAGADGQALGQGMAEQLASRLGEWTVSTETVGGRTVIKLAADDASGEFVPHYFVPIGDTVVDVQGNPPAWAEEAISKLP